MSDSKAIFLLPKFMTYFNSVGKSLSDLLGNDRDGNTLSDGPYVVTVYRVSGAFLLEPVHIN